MDIKEILKDSLVQIITGINEANEEFVSVDAFVASSNIRCEKTPSYTEKNNVKQ